MRTFRLLAIACALVVATSAHELEEAKSPKVQASTQFPVTPYGIVDWTVGFLYGSYMPLHAKANNYDC